MTDKSNHMIVSVQEKIEQIKHKKYAYQWDIFLKSSASSVDTALDRMLIAYADISDHLSAGPPIQRPAYLGKGGRDIYSIDFSLVNAWGNGLFFHFGERYGNPRDGFYRRLWCEYIGIPDTRLYIEQCADVFSRSEEDKVVSVQPIPSLRISIATNQGWLWQEMVWHVISGRLSKEGYEDDTLGIETRVRLFDTLKELQETDVFEKLLRASKEKITETLNHPTEFDRKYFMLRSDRYVDIDETVQSLKDPGRIRSIDISSLGLVDMPESVSRLTSVKDIYAENNAFTSFPPVLSLISSAEKLLLAHNRIASIPPSISQLQGLSFLSLNNNELTELPEEIGSLGNLEVLLLSGNKLTRLPDALAQLSRLRTLRIADNPMSESEVERIRALLPACYVDTEKTHLEKTVESMMEKHKKSVK